MNKLAPWLGAVAIIVIIFGTMYAVVQQAQRRDANYPQIQMAQDAARALNAGTVPKALTTGYVNMAASLAPFTIIYNKDGHVVAGSGYLRNHIPTVDKGVLTAAAGQAYHAVTWQPETGVRIAAVSVAANNYYVLSGRSITAVEDNENVTFWLSAFGSALALFVLLIAFLFSRVSAKV